MTSYSPIDENIDKQSFWRNLFMQEFKTGRVMIVGLDGATLDLIRPWAESGILPTFQRLFREGSYGKLRSTMPPLTPAAWSSFLTGVNPGKHGIFDFTGHRDDGEGSYIVQSVRRHAPSLWQLASRGGKRVIVYNVPVTYPPERVNGLMISGLMTPPDAKDAAFPPELQEELEQVVPGHSFFSNHGLFRKGYEVEFVKMLMDHHQKNFEAARYLMHKQPWDLLVVEFQHSDTAGHFLWRYMEDGGVGLTGEAKEIVANAMRDIYRDLDAKLGTLIQEAGEDTRVIIMSDHGHGPMKHYFIVNTFLLEKGFIRLKPDVFTSLKYRLFMLGFSPALVYSALLKIKPTEKLRTTENARVVTAKERAKRIFISLEDVDWSRTRAYSDGYGGPIYVNLKGREAHGIVEPGKEYEEVLEGLTQALLSIKEPGTDQPLIGEIHRGRDVYSGPFADRGPDLIFFPKNWEYNSAGKLEFNTRRWLVPAKNRTGHHRMDGIFFAAGPGIRQGFEVSGASILDIAPTALALLRLPVPEEMDGSVLRQMMTPELSEDLEITYSPAGVSTPDWVPVEEMSIEDEEILLTRLRNLGYIA
jgi:predicted AlkP superfamily phosphohydrolase/phosphomutase